MRYPQENEVLVVYDRSKLPAGINKEAIHRQFADEAIGVRVRDIINNDDERHPEDIPPGSSALTAETVECEANVILCCDIVLLDAPYYSPIDYSEFTLADLRRFGIWPECIPC